MLFVSYCNCSLLVCPAFFSLCCCKKWRTTQSVAIPMMEKNMSKALFLPRIMCRATRKIRTSKVFSVFGLQRSLMNSMPTTKLKTFSRNSKKFSALPEACKSSERWGIKRIMEIPRPTATRRARKSSRISHAF